VADRNDRAGAFRDAQLLTAGTDLNGLEEVITLAEWLLDGSTALLIAREESAGRIGIERERAIPRAPL
jgi:hypothetical protein